jgi:hypothetical protein
MMEMYKNYGVATAQPDFNIVYSHNLAVKETILKSVISPPDETNNNESSTQKKREKGN